MIAASLALIPSSLVPAMLTNIVLSGGTSEMKGFAARFEKEVQLANPHYKVTVVALPNRQHLHFQGGT